MMRATLAALLVMCMAVEASASLGDLCPKGDEDCGENQVCDLNMAYGSNGIQIGARCVCKDKYEDNGQGSCTLIPGFCDFDVCNDYKDCEDCEAPLICAPTGVCAYPPAEYAGGAAGLASPSSPEDPEPNGGSGKQLGDLCPKGDQDCGENQVCDLNMAYGSNGIQIGARCVCKDKYEDDGQGSCTLIPGFCDFDVCNDYKDCEDCEAPLICAPTGVCAYPPAEYAGGAAGLASPSSPEDPEPNGGSGKQLGDLCPKGDQDCGENQVCDLNMAYGSNGIQIGARCKCQDGYEDDGEGVCRRIPHPFCLNDAWCGTVFANQICVLASNTCICKPGYETVPSPDGWVPSFTCQLAPGSCWNDADCPEGDKEYAQQQQECFPFH
ncbi:hypothetical protein A3770_08p51530 [Chloropicon primus]|uniref:EGF-like domain-containing protein n=1 Tax=Chloropicon primus TaxID=1764295 RepID=A0A5B8MSN0_9CHLO|nr:hypothetical protein A3770_08p51530 [Chloropicon primus]|eukprot:QDZ22635.1 hypothetical protein A3770_08p51530 [Chloropicon primus]